MDKQRFGKNLLIGKEAIVAPPPALIAGAREEKETAHGRKTEAQN
jgi:hypothetical protein